MKLTIETAENGILVTSPKEDLLYDTVHTVFEDRNNLEHYRDMCYHILECVGYIGSKHDEERLFIEIRKQNDND